MQNANFEMRARSVHGTFWGVLRLTTMLGCLAWASAVGAQSVPSEAGQGDVVFAPEAHQGAASRPGGVLLATSEPAGPELAEALQMELAGRGMTVLVGPDVGPGSGLTRASNAQSLARLVGAGVVLWVEEGPADASTVRAVEVNGEAVRHAPFSGTLASVDPRTFAVVASSLLDEIRRPPARIRVRVRVEVEGEGVEIDTGSASVQVPDGRNASATLAEDAYIEVPLSDPLPDSVVEIPVVPEPATDAPPETPRAPDVPDADNPVDAEMRRVFFGADLFPYVGSSSFHRGRESRALSLGVWAHAGEMTAVAFSLGMNTTRGRMGGLMMAGLGNIAGADSRGLQLATGFNWVKGNFSGTQATTGFNFVHGDVSGVQLSTGANIATGHVRGLQASSGVNFARGGHGVQIGSLNIQRGSFDGVQLGLVNISDDADFALGLLNIVRNGRTHLEVTANSEGFVQVAAKHGGAHWHYLYSVLARPFSEGDNDAVYGFGLGMGARITPSERLFVDLDVLGHWMSDGDVGNAGTETLAQGRVLVGFQVFDRVALVAGLSYNVVSAYRDPSSYGTFGETVLHDDEFGDWTVRGFPSVSLGVQIF